MIRLLSSRGVPTPCTKFALDKLPGNEWDPVPNYLMPSGDYRDKRTDRNEVDDTESEGETERYGNKRLHRFGFKDSLPPYNPWRAWFIQAEMQRSREAWDPPGSAQVLERALGMDEEWQDMWAMFRWSEGRRGGDKEEDGKSQWYLVCLNEWLSTFERDYRVNSKDKGETADCLELEFDLDRRNWRGFFNYGYETELHQESQV